MLSFLGRHKWNIRKNVIIALDSYYDDIKYYACSEEVYEHDGKVYEEHDKGGYDGHFEQQNYGGEKYYYIDEYKVVVLMYLLMRIKE